MMRTQTKFWFWLVCSLSIACAGCQNGQFFSNGWWSFTSSDELPDQYEPPLDDEAGKP